MSPRAAWRLESLGFSQVFDYVTGKVDWLASGLPTEGKDAHVLRAKDCVRRDSATCRLTDRLGDIQRSIEAAGQEGCVVVSETGVVLGYVSNDTFEAAPDTTADQAMAPGPPTIRPHVSLGEITEYLQKRGIDKILVTTADGQLMGLLYRHDAEQMHG